MATVVIPLSDKLITNSGAAGTPVLDFGFQNCWQGRLKPLTPRSGIKPLVDWELFTEAF